MFQKEGDSKKRQKFKREGKRQLTVKSGWNRRGKAA